MKKNLLIIALGAIVALTSSCGSSKQVANNDYYNNPNHPVYPKNNNTGTGDDGFVTIKKNATEEYAEAAPGRRAVGTATHFKESTAVQLAEANARRAMSDALAAAIISASKQGNINLEKYAGGVDDAEMAVDAAYQSNTLVRSISQNTIAGSVVVKKEKLYNKNTRQYKIYVCVEYMGDLKDVVKKTVKEVKDRISEEDRLKIEYNLKKFEDEVYGSLTSGAQ